MFKFHSALIPGYFTTFVGIFQMQSSDPFICRLCEHQPQMATYDLLRAHLRAVHRKKDLSNTDLALYEIFPGSRYMVDGVQRPPPPSRPNFGASSSFPCRSCGPDHPSEAPLINHHSFNMNDVEKLIESHVKNGLRASLRIVTDKLNTFEVKVADTIQSSISTMLQNSLTDFLTNREVNVGPSTPDGGNSIESVVTTVDQSTNTDLGIVTSNVDGSIELPPVIPAEENPNTSTVTPQNSSVDVLNTAAIIKSSDSSSAATQIVEKVDVPVTPKVEIDAPVIPKVENTDDKPIIDAVAAEALDSIISESSNDNPVSKSCIVRHTKTPYYVLPYFYLQIDETTIVGASIPTIDLVTPPVHKNN